MAKYSATILKHHGYNTPKPPVFIYHGHQGKEKAYVNALRKAGYRPSAVEHMRARFVLYDLDCFRRREALERLSKRKIPVFMYPHAARPQVVWDGMHNLWMGTRCSFVPTKGHEEVMHRYGYPLPIEVTGWTYCDILPFQPVKKVQNILFGPIHPSRNGMILAVDKDLNTRTFKRLVAYCRESGVQLTVRYIGHMGNNGIYPVEGVKFINGATDLSTADIDAADLVVGHQTFAYLSVARGKPTLMMGEDVPPRTILPDGSPVYVKSWEKYADILMFPLDILAEDAAVVIEKARKRNAKVTAWRERFIGEPFEPKAFVEKLERHL